MKSILTTLLIFTLCANLSSQSDVPVIQTLDLTKAPKGKISKYWLHIADNGLAQPVLVPVIVAKGIEDGPVLGLTAAIHGNELNGIPIIQEVFKKIDPAKLQGTLVGVPGLNIPGMQMDQRGFIDGEDLNRLFPGRDNGDISQQYTRRIFDRIVRHFTHLIDMHTASFGRVNSLYVRADMGDSLLAKLSHLQFPDIIVNNKGAPSAGAGSGEQTLRAEAVNHGIPCLTIEYGNPQVYQPEMIQKGTTGVMNAMAALGMIKKSIPPTPSKAVVCKKSYWIYTDMGGLLEIPVELAQTVKKGELIGILKNPFGDVLKEYFSPEDGVIIGKSTNPVNMNGGRILHLGVQ